eukprot:XP_001705563.1 Hypothetical protein GL50803_113327 [Giardia lamblia ATCC 50803]
MLVSKRRVVAAQIIQLVVIAHIAQLSICHCYLLTTDPVVMVINLETVWVVANENTRVY